MKKCRFCNTELINTFVDLEMSPVSNSYIKQENLQSRECFYPLHVYVCHECFLVQLEEIESHENIFNEEYAYFSSYSDSWLKHCKAYSDMISKKLDLANNSLVVEIASNDGYLLQYFKEKNIPVLGIEPSMSVAKVAQEKGVETIIDFFSQKMAQKQDKKADLIAGNNVLAHVPDINDFVAGLKILLKNEGTITMEFPHLLNLIKYNQFDTIYHEHFSYLSLYTVQKIFNEHGLDIYDVEELPTHGGSLRIYACQSGTKSITNNILDLLNKEKGFGLQNLTTYSDFSEKVRETKRKLLEFLIQLKNSRKTVIGYGAAAKGNTLLNYCGIRQDFIDYVVDKSPHKQGLFLPGTHIPIYSPEKIVETKPDYILILPWNIKDEIIEQLSYIQEWGGRFIVPIPEVREVLCSLQKQN
ncbi:MAG: SAM-dependent methyltransferase [Candidatus Melainabacteria bacterium GWF2_37_15]|nr:MAG: SAM-dependent methyltransferase [Candidatus Melainabacteria bacterium GWF2_37_15]